MTCQICHRPASFVYVTLDTAREIPMCAPCAGRYITHTVDQCRAHDPLVSIPPVAQARLN